MRDQPLLGAVSEGNPQQGWVAFRLPLKPTLKKQNAPASFPNQVLAIRPNRHRPPLTDSKPKGLATVPWLSASSLSSCTPSSAVADLLKGPFELKTQGCTPKKRHAQTALSMVELWKSGCWTSIPKSPPKGATISKSDPTLCTTRGGLRHRTRCL